MKPVAFLDVDDTLIVWHPGGGKTAMPGVTEFFRWLKEHFEVRWLTMWSPTGKILGNDGRDLASVLGVGAPEIWEVVNPHAFPVNYGRIPLGQDYRAKHDSIKAMLAETPDREWVWIEDAYIEEQERKFAEAHEGRYFETFSDTVLHTALALAKKYNLPLPEVEGFYFTGTKQLISNVHRREASCDEGCVIHNPTDARTDWPTHWRADRRIMERICEHGVGHPDRDQIRFWERTLGPERARVESIHGCCGCCGAACRVA